MSLMIKRSKMLITGVLVALTLNLLVVMLFRLTSGSGGNSADEPARSAIVDKIDANLFASEMQQMADVYRQQQQLVSKRQQLPELRRDKWVERIDDHDAVFGSSPAASWADPYKTRLLLSVWSREYEALYRRAPPTNYDKWLRFASQRRCYLHPRYYRQIDADLAPFRDPRNARARSIDRRMQQEACNITRHHPYFTSVLEVSARDGLKQKMASQLDNVWPLLFTGELLSILPEAPTAATSGNRTATASTSGTKPIRLVTNIEEARILVPDEKCWDTHHARNRRLHSYVDQVYERLPDYRLAFGERWLRPLFTHSKLAECHRDILLPGPLFFESTPIVTNRSWSQKRSEFAWRGSTTGGFHFLDRKYEKTHRFRFVKWAMEQNKRSAAHRLPLVVNVGFTDTVQCNRSTCAQIRKDYLFTYNMTQEQQHEAKYVPVVDGNVFPARLRGYLFSNSLLFISSIFTHWFSQWLVPFYHYIPFDLDLSDLEENIRWALNNDDKARRIAERAQKFATEHLRFDDMQCYAGLVLLEYAQLLE